MNNMYSVILLILLLFLSFFLYNKLKKKTIAIFGSISKDISNDSEFKEELDILVDNINTSKYDYIIPNTLAGPIGYILNNVKDKDKSGFITTYSTTFNQKINEIYKVISFDDAIHYEEYMVRNSDIFIFLPGGIGTLYEVAFISFLIDLNEGKEIKVIFYNRDNDFNFIKDLINYYNDNGFLRGETYNNFIKNTYFVKNMNDIVSLL